MTAQLFFNFVDDFALTDDSAGWIKGERYMGEQKDQQATSGHGKLPFITSDAHIAEILEAHRDRSPEQGVHGGYLNHCLRMLNVCLAVSQDEPDRLEKLQIALAFHDLTLFPDGTLDYLGSSSALARDYLAAQGKEAWGDQIEAMICHHHKIRPYRGDHANLTEAMRKADWIDVSFRLLNFGLDRRWLRELHRALPLYSFYPRRIMPVILSYMLRHPRKPLPNFRW